MCILHSSSLTDTRSNAKPKQCILEVVKKKEVPKNGTAARAAACMDAGPPSSSRPSSRGPSSSRPSSWAPLPVFCDGLGLHRKGGCTDDAGARGWRIQHVDLDSASAPVEVGRPSRGNRVRETIPWKVTSPRLAQHPDTALQYKPSKCRRSDTAPKRSSHACLRLTAETSDYCSGALGTSPLPTPDLPAAVTDPGREAARKGGRWLKTASTLAIVSGYVVQRPPLQVPLPPVDPRERGLVHPSTTRPCHPE